MSNKDGLVDLRAIIKECDRVRKLFSDKLSHNTIGKNIGFYSNGDHSYQTINITDKSGYSILKAFFTTTGRTEVSIDSAYINRRSLNSIVKRLKAIV